MKSTWNIKSHQWQFVKELKKGIDNQTGDYLEFTSNWLCPDGDCVSLYIADVEKEYEGGFTLHCFSGIPASEIYIDDIDFQYIQYIKGFPKDGFWEKEYIEKCLIVADFICEKFCEYSE